MTRERSRTKARAADIRSCLRGTDDRPWLVYLACPLLLGIIVKVFPVARFEAGLIVASVLLVLVASGTLLRLDRRPVVVMASGSILLGAILCLPFIAVRSGASASADVRPTYSYLDAKADPAAFAKWWNLFVDEVVRTNAIVLERDPRGTPSGGVLPYRPIPGATADFYRGRISINRQGYRGDEFSQEKGKDVYRILTIGDSVTFGQTLFPDSLPWPARLEKMIARDLDCGRKVEVVNGAVNGYRLRNAIDRVRHDAAWLKPDLVLSYFGWNTMIDLGIDPAVEPAPPPPKSADKLAVASWHVRKAASALAAATRSRIASSVAEVLGDAAYSGDTQTRTLLATARKSVLEADYRSLVHQARLLGHRLVLLSFNTAVTSESPEEVKAFYQSITHAFRPLLKQVEIHNLMLREIASETQTPFFDTGSDLRGEYDEDLYIDAVHFTSKGDLRLARNVYRDLRPLLMTDPALRCRPR